MLKSNLQDVLMSVSSDRAVYPPGGVLHVRVLFGSAVDTGRIVFEVFNSRRERLASKTVDPERGGGDPELARENIFETSFRMSGDDWRVGQTYVVRATYGGSYSEDVFRVDRADPVVQTDKSAYRVGDDMVVTVIDPSFDKDSRVAEFVGDRPDSKLVIESKHGRIDGYRLKESGKSTGMFYGMVGVLETHEDGTVIPRDFYGEVVDKIQGRGIDDGFIGGRPGEQIILTYKNGTATASGIATIT